MEKERKLEVLPIVNAHAAGIDIGSRNHFVAVGQSKEQVRKFGCYTDSLVMMCQWLKHEGVQSVAMESTGDYWKGVYAILQREGFEVLLVNGKYTKNVKAKKTDVLDCQWIQKLHSLGLLEGSFIPEAETEKLKQFCRHRQSMLEDAASYIKRMQKALRQTNIRLDVAVRDVTGQSGMAIIEAIIAGERDPEKLASLADRRVKKSKSEIARPLTGDWQEEYIFALKQSHEIYHMFHEKIRECDQAIERLMQNRSPKNPLHGASEIVKKRLHKNAPDIDLQKFSYNLTGGIDLSAIDGVSHMTLLTLLSEVGVNLSAFPTAKHFASWLRLSPNNKISGSRIISSKTLRGKHRLADALRHAANVIGHGLKSGALHQFFIRIAFRKGKMAAITATARKLAVIIWNMLTRRQGFNYLQESEYLMQMRTRRIQNLRRQIGQLHLTPEELTPLLSFVTVK